MSIKSLMDYTFVAKYARWIPDKKRRETWHETVNRVRDMMLKKTLILFFKIPFIKRIVRFYNVNSFFNFLL